MDESWGMIETAQVMNEKKDVRNMLRKQSEKKERACNESFESNMIQRVRISTLFLGVSKVKRHPI